MRSNGSKGQFFRPKKNRCVSPWVPSKFPLQFSSHSSLILLEVGQSDSRDDGGGGGDDVMMVVVMGGGEGGEGLTLGGAESGSEDLANEAAPRGAVLRPGQGRGLRQGVLPVLYERGAPEEHVSLVPPPGEGFLGIAGLDGRLPLRDALAGENGFVRDAGACQEEAVCRNKGL